MSIEGRLFKLQNDKAKIRVSRNTWKAKAEALQSRLDNVPIPNRQTCNLGYVEAFNKWLNKEKSK